MTNNGREIVSHVRAVSVWGTHLNLPRVCFKRCGGSKQAVLREKLAHKAEDNIGLSQTTQGIVIIISHGGGSCSECWFARQFGDTIYFHRYPESDNLVVSTKVTVYASYYRWLKTEEICRLDVNKIVECAHAQREGRPTVVMIVWHTIVSNVRLFANTCIAICV